jgi:hypothetical membrane protein
MHKAIPLFVILFLCLQIFAQENLPTIKATSSSVDIRVGDDYFAKGGWALDPNRKPDVFSIGSKWLYESKKVTFTTDLDSISFDVQPGSKHDFIVLLNDSIPCHIQIATLANPIFMQPRLVFPLLFGFLLFCVFLYLFRSKINSLRLLYFGYAAPLAFWCITLLSAYVHGDYNHFKNVISELGAIGTKSEILTSTLLMVLATFCILFSTGFYRVSRKLRISTIPAILSFAMPFPIFWAGIFPLGNEFHGTTGPLPFLILLGYLIAWTQWKRKPGFSRMSNISLISFLISMLLMLRFIQPLGQEYEGLIQRFFYLGWTVWTIAITYSLSQKLKEPLKEHV